MPDDILDAAQKAINDAAGQSTPVVPPPTVSSPTPTPPQQLPKPKKKSLGPILAVLLLLVAAIPLGVRFASQQQALNEIRSKAAGAGSLCVAEGGKCVPKNYVCSGGDSTATSMGCGSQKCGWGTCNVPSAPPPAANEPCNVCVAGRCVEDARPPDCQHSLDICNNPGQSPCKSTTSPPSGGDGSTPPVGGSTHPNCNQNAIFNPNNDSPRLVADHPTGCEYCGGQNNQYWCVQYVADWGVPCTSTKPADYPWTGKDYWLKPAPGKTVVSCLTNSACPSKPSVGCGGTPTPTSAPPAGPQCLNIKIYKNNILVDPTTLQTGDNVVLAVVGTNATKAKFRVNGGAFTETATTNASGEYTLNFTVPGGITSFTIEAEVFKDGQWK